MTTDAPQEPAANDDRPRPVSVLLWSAWFGLVGGALELAAFLAKCHYFDPRNYNVSRQFPWMYPASGLAVVAVPGVVLALAVWVWPKRVGAWIVLLVLTFPAYLGILFRLPLMTAACLALASGLALRTASMLATRVVGFDRVVRRSLPVLGGAFVVAVLACQARGVRLESPKAANGGPNVLLVVLDTVRAESLSLYGYGRETSPNLARYAARGVRFDMAFSTAPWTAPSHAGMFTGRSAGELSVGWDRPLDRSRLTLAEHLAGQGYATAGFVANTTYCSYETGLDRGFAHYEDYDVTPWSVLLCSSIVQRGLTFVEKHPSFARWGIRPEAGHRKSGERINRDVLRWLAGRPVGRPFFAFLNYYDAHHPYFAPEDGKPESEHDEHLLRSWWGTDKRKLSPRDVTLARDAYDRCITSLDRQVGRLLDTLDGQGVLANTLVIITADHGEHLGEQNLYGHGISLYRPELHVPLVILPPGGVPTGRVVRRPVSLRDLPATVVDLLDTKDGSPFPGHSLAADWSDGADPDRSRDEPVLSEVAAPPEDDPNHGASPVCRGPMTSLVAWGYHYVRNGDGREELFDLAVDPGEGHNLASAAESSLVLGRFRSHLPR